MINDAGYQFATGRMLPTNGQCDTATTEAIRWYQRVLNVSSNGLVQPTDTGFIRPISEATTPGWRPSNTPGPLRVSEGQITFDAEGTDYIPPWSLSNSAAIPIFHAFVNGRPRIFQGYTWSRLWCGQ